MSVDVSQADVQEYYKDYKQKLSAFLQSTEVNAEAEKFLGREKYTYIFGHFGIRPQRARASPEQRYALEKKVITEMINHMMIVPAGILRIHVAKEYDTDNFLTPIKKKTLLWYQMPTGSPKDFRICNMIDSETRLNLSVAKGDNLRAKQVEESTQLITDQTQVIATVELGEEDIELYTFSKDDKVVLRVVFTNQRDDFSFPAWCRIMHPVIEDATDEAPRPDIITKLKNFETKFQKEHGTPNTCFFEVPFDDNLKCKCMLKSTLEYTGTQVSRAGNAFEVTATPIAAMQLYVVSSEAVRVQLDAAEWVGVPEYQDKKIGTVKQSAADEVLTHKIQIERLSGERKSETFSVCVDKSLYAQHKRTDDHMHYVFVGDAAQSDMQRLLRMMNDLNSKCLTEQSRAPPVTQSPFR
jgi:hypothetical protein